MSVWNSAEDVSPFENIAQERFVNTKYALPADDFETNPWLQMFMHELEDYRQDVSEKATTVKSLTLKIEPSVQRVGKQERKKMSRRQAQAAAAAKVVKVAACEGSEARAETNVSEEPAIPTTAVAIKAAPETAQEVLVPQGNVVICNASGLSLIADAAGRLTWAAAETIAEHPVWTLSAAGDGKFILRSCHGKYLSHCLFNWGLIADRTSASEWEKFIVKGVKPTAEGEETAFSLQSWRGLFVSATEDGKVGLLPTAEAAGAKLRIQTA
jgi:hypothetical protein